MTRIDTGFLVIALLGAFSHPALAANQKFDPEANRLLRKMSDFLASQNKFSFSADHQIETVLKSGEKLEFSAKSQVKVERPNKFRSDRQGDIAQDASLFYDGKNMTLFGRGVDLYATTPAPANINQAIDFARSKLDLEAPGADLLYSNPYKILMEDAVSGIYVEKAKIDGIPAHHLAFRGNETDWQIWIADGEKPLPLKYVITSKKVKSLPEFSVQIRDWNFAPSFDANTFAFTAPPEAGQIQFAGVAESKPKTGKKEG